MAEIACLAIGRSTHTLVVREEDGSFQEQKFANSRSGATGVLAEGVKRLIVVGNREWAIACASFLSQSGVEVRYVGEKTQKGAKQNKVKFAQRVLAAGITGRPFFGEKRPEASIDVHPWYRTAMEYYTATDEVRTAKHLVLSTLSVLFPEAVQPSREERKKGLPIPDPMPPGIWTKKMASVFEDPDPLKLQSNPVVPAAVRTLAENSLGLWIPPDVRDRYRELHKGYVNNLREWEERKKDAVDRLRNLVRDHPMLTDWPESDSVLVVIGFLVWRTWPSWRELRAFCGLDVTRIGDKGPRISRKRPEVRQYLYLLMTRTKRARALAGTKKRRVKRIERLLKSLRLLYLK